MTADEPASVRLVNALIGRSQAQLAGRIDTLAEAQRTAAETSSREHAQVRDSIAQIDRCLEALDGKVDGIARQAATDAATDAIVAMWRRRFLAALVSAVSLITPLVVAALERWLST